MLKLFRTQLQLDLLMSKLRETNKMAGDGGRWEGGYKTDIIPTCQWY